MAGRRPPRRSGPARRRLSGRPGRAAAPAGSLLPTLEAFVLHDGGQISVGKIGPIACAAVASDDHVMYAALQRHPDETLAQLLQRLDAALLRALDHEEYIDEING